MSTEAPVAPATPAPAPPTSFGEAMDQALGSTILPPSAAVPASRRAAEMPTAPVAPVEPVAPVVAPTEPVAAAPAEVVTPAATADPNDPFAALRQATAEYQKPEEPVVPVVEPEVHLPENATEPQKTAFATITTKLREAQAEIQAMKAARESASVTPQNDAELQVRLDNVTKERDEYVRNMEVIRYESTPKYQNEVVKPMKQLGAQLQGLATQNKAGTGAILEALQKPDMLDRRAALKEATKEWDPVDALEARTAVEHLVQLHERRTELLANAKQNYESYMEQQQSHNKAKQEQFATETSKAFEEMWPQFQKAIPFLAPRENDPAWNASLTEIKEAAIKLDSQPLSHTQRAALTYQAVSLPVVVNALTQMGKGILEENAKLKEENKNLRAAAPGSGTPSGDLDLGLPSSVGFLDAFEQKLKAKGIK